MSSANSLMISGNKRKDHPVHAVEAPSQALARRCASASGDFEPSATRGSWRMQMRCSMARRPPFATEPDPAHRSVLVIRGSLRCGDVCGTLPLCVIVRMRICRAR